MKNNFIFLGLAALVLSSCSKDDDGPSIDNSELTKKWYYVSDVVNGTTIPYDDHEACGKDYVEFLPGGVARDVDVWDCEEDEFLMGWTLSGDKLTVTSGSSSRVATIKKLTATQFEVQTQYDYDGDGNEDTVVEKMTSVE